MQFSPSAEASPLTVAIPLAPAPARPVRIPCTESAASPSEARSYGFSSLVERSNRRVDRWLLAGGLLAGAALPPGGTPAPLEALRFTLADLVLAVLLFRAAPLLAGALDVYGARAGRPAGEAALRLGGWYAGMAGLLAAGAWVRGPAWIDPERSLAAWPLLFVAAWALRAWSRPRMERAAKHRARPAVILGGGARARGLARELRDHPEYGVRVVGFVDAEERTLPPEEGVPRLGGPEALEGILFREPVAEVLATLPVRSHHRTLQEALRACERTGTVFRYRADEFGSTSGARGACVAFRPYPRGPQVAAKRAVDVAGALAGIVLLLPLLLVLAAAVKATSPGPVIFAQTRCGRFRRRFRMFKFRTMVVDAEARQAELEARNEAAGPLFKIRDDPRVTPLGRFLRRTSLDELPQLFNVLRGEMSLVGPRPLPLRDVALFDEPWLMRRFSVRPGLTGLWQVRGRSSAGDWAAHDLQYIDRWSLALDLRILLRTVPAVVRGTGAA